MRRIRIGTLILFAGLWTSGSVIAEELSVDRPTSIGGIETVCTGTGLEARGDPRWKAFALRLEFSTADGHYLGDETVSINGNGQSFDVHCDGPWILLDLPEGNYKIEAQVADAGRKVVTAHVPATGQARVVVSFSNGSEAEGRANSAG